MLPSLKKIHSVDYAGPQRQLEGGSAGTGTTRNPPLMHSVSIVVELAVEKQPTEESSDEEDLAESIDIKAAMIGEKKQSDLSSSRQTKEVEGTISTKSKGDNDDYDEEEEEEEDDEAASCLSSDLARKVVIVDEADKILQFRAQSAEPRIGATSSGEGGIETLQDVGLLSLSGTKTTTTTTTTTECTIQKPAGSTASRPSTTMRSNTIAGRECPSIGAALRDSRKWQRANTQAGPYSSTSGASGSAGELAERGELAKLGMRRYTHHQVIYNPAPIGGVRGGVGLASASSSATMGPPRVGAYSAQLDTDCPQKKSVGGNIQAQSYQRQQQDGDQSMQLWQSSASSPTSSSPLLALSGGLSSPTAVATKLASGTGSVKNWPQRRQSLQINLLGSCGSGVCKSLTQEELRGEREFNEQVRNAKSPDSSISGALHQQYPSQYQQKLSSFSCSASQVPKCQSRAPGLEGTGLASTAATNTTKTKSATQKADQSGQADNIGKITPTSFASSSSSSSQETTKTCYRQISDLPPASSQLLSGSAITYKPTRQSSTAQIQTGRRRVSFGSIDPIIDRAEPLSGPFGFNSPLQHSDDAASAQVSQFESSQDSSPTKSELINNSSGTRFANPTALKFDRTKQQTSCLKSIAGQKRHSLATSVNASLYSGVEPSDRKFVRTDDNQASIGDTTVNKLSDREENRSDENFSRARSTISSTRKMNDNSSPQAEPAKEGDIDATGK